VKVKWLTKSAIKAPLRGTDLRWAGQLPADGSGGFESLGGRKSVTIFTYIFTRDFSKGRNEG